MMIIDPYRFGGGCPPYTTGLYTAEELDQMIFVDGYIPVANAVELDALRTSSTRTMGEGTCWEGEYNVSPVGKKYVQILEIDASGFTNWDRIEGFISIYDGNELVMKNFTQNISFSTGVFDTMETGTKFYNIRLSDSNFVTTQTSAGYYAGVLFTWCRNGFVIDNCVVENCHVSNVGSVSLQAMGCFAATVLSNSLSGIINNCHVIDCSATNNSVASTGRNVNHGTSGFMNLFGCTVTNCSVSNTVINCTKSSSGAGFASIISGGIVTDCYAENIEVNGNPLAMTQYGGFVGVAMTGAEIVRCYATGKVTGYQRVGGFIGYFFDNTTDECYADCEVIGGIEAGGFAGAATFNTDVATDCYAHGEVSGTQYIGGFLGRILSNRPKWKKCYSTGLVTGGLYTGGFAGSMNPLDATNSYWDTVTSGQATSAGGIGKTTSDLQTPTSNTGIYSAWTIPPWTFGTASEYPTLTTTP